MLVAVYSLTSETRHAFILGQGMAALESEMKALHTARQR